MPFLDIPKCVNIVDKTVEKVDGSKVLLKDGKMITSFDNIIGEVEAVLSNDVSIISFKDTYGLKSFKALATSDDVFKLDFNPGTNESNFNSFNPHKFISAGELWNFTAKGKKESLWNILTPGTKVKMNVLPLITNTPNEADIFYCTAGVLTGRNCLKCPVPIIVSKVNNSCFTIQFKREFCDILSRLDANGNTKLEIPPLLCGKVRKAWRKGAFGKVFLPREGYQKVRNIPCSADEEKATKMPINQTKALPAIGGSREKKVSSYVLKLMLDWY